MWRMLLGLFLVAHGLIHAAIWATPKSADAPFDAARSWLLNGLGTGAPTVRTISVVLALIATLGFVTAGLGLLFHASWWAVVAAGSAAGSFLLIALFFNPWLIVGLGLEVAIVAGLLVAGWPSRTPLT